MMGASVLYIRNLPSLPRRCKGQIMSPVQVQGPQEKQYQSSPVQRSWGTKKLLLYVWMNVFVHMCVCVGVHVCTCACVTCVHTYAALVFMFHPLQCLLSWTLPAVSCPRGLDALASSCPVLRCSIAEGQLLSQMRPSSGISRCLPEKGQVTKILTLCSLSCGLPQLSCHKP